MALPGQRAEGSATTFAGRAKAALAASAGAAPSRLA
jgi:hypothetical protein